MVRSIAESASIQTSESAVKDEGLEAVDQSGTEARAEAVPPSRDRALPPILFAVFTGIVQHLGRVASVETVASGRRLWVDFSGWDHRPAMGESIAVDGCCLTVAKAGHEGAAVGFDVIQQTLEVTTLGGLAKGSAVNLEHSVTPATLLGGHIVQGHVDGVGRVVGVVRSAAEHRVRIVPPEASAMSLIVEKGSIAVNGVSLTVAAVGPDWLEVALIPTTLSLTNLGSLEEGDGVNLEYDYIAKVVTNWLQHRDGGKRRDGL